MSFEHTEALNMTYEMPHITMACDLSFGQTEALDTIYETPRIMMEDFIERSNVRDTHHM